MTTYNGERFLCRQLDSIIAQTVTGWELIVCDDCSNDSTPRILEEYAEKDKRIKLYYNKQNLGFVKNFEKAISLCSGDYIALSDQDDIWTDNHLEVLLANMNDSTASVGNALIIDGDDNKSDEVLSDRDRYYVEGNNEDKLTRILFYGNPFQGTSSLYKRRVFDYAMPIPNGVDYHDAWFASVACCLNGLNYTHDVITYYRIYGKNTSGSHIWNYWKQISASFKRTGWKTDRVIFCDELQKRIQIIPNNISKIINDAKSFHINRLNGNRFKTILTLINNYKKIYATNSYKHILSRCINVLING